MILEGLNKEQSDAVLQTEGPVMIIAGAGSGKTRTLTYRIAYLLEKGISPYNILSLTFTNKAAKEMQERIVSLVGLKAKAILAGTFHSIFCRILRIECEKIGFPRNFSIYDSEDSKKLIAEIVKNMRLDEKNYRKGNILSRISAVKCALFDPEHYALNANFRQEDLQANIPLFYKIYETYQARLRRAGAMDFDDILFNMSLLLRDHKDVADKYRKRFEYILVDEYQDTNYSQYYIIRKLAEYHRNICVVGDDAQSIYAFRGANINNILGFTKDYPDAHTFRLEQNYRSTKNIIEAANSVIAQNENQIKKTLWTDNDRGESLHYFELGSDREEAFFVTGTIRNLIDAGEKPGQTAILYRTNSQSRAFEEKLRTENIPYIIYGGTSFYERKEIKDAIAYLRLVVNNNDDEAFERIVNVPARKIGKTTIDKLKIVRGQEGLSLFTICSDPEILLNRAKIGSNTIKALEAFCTMIRSFSLRVEKDDAFTLGNEIIKRSGLRLDLAMMKDPEDKNRIENLDEFLSGMQSFVQDEQEDITDALTGEQIDVKSKTLDSFLQQVALMTSTDSDDKDEDSKVKLMTIHCAKGLEFDNVFVVGMEEDLFPSSMSYGERNAMEEERRLFYVALTRARKNLCLTSACTRFKFGDVKVSETSRFVLEIDQRYIVCKSGNSEQNKKTFPLSRESSGKKTLPLSTKADKEKKTFSLRSNAMNNGKSSFADTMKKKRAFTPDNNKDDSWSDSVPKDIFEGVHVFHSKFKEGVVLSTEIVAGDKRALVDFGDNGVRKMILKFANLKIRTNKDQIL